MDFTKIQLSAEELRLVTDAQVILTKNRVIEKVYELFGLLSSAYQTYAPAIVYKEILSAMPKISKGEHYNGLPYVMLDYPRYFSTKDVLSIRTMFWWGNHFSITLHVKGEFKMPVVQGILANEYLCGTHDWFIQTAGDEWQHHYTTATHIAFNAVDEIRKKEIFEQSDFIKITSFLPLNEWNESYALLVEKFKIIIKMISEY